MAVPTICPSCGARNIEGVDECKNCGADLRAIDLPKPVSKIEQSVMQLPLTALGMTKIHVMPPDTVLADAIQTLLRQQLDIVEIVDNGRLIGVLSVRDIVMRVGTDYASKLGRPVSEFMTKAPETLPPDAPINYAINKMDVGGYRHVPVVQGDRMLGVVSVRDVIHHVIKHSRETVITAGRTTSHGVSTTPA